MIKNILIIIFSLISFVNTYICSGRFIRGQEIPGGNVWLMAIGIVGLLATLFLQW